MSFTPSERDRTKAAVIAEALEVVSAAIRAEAETLGFEHDVAKTKAVLFKVADDLANRGLDYQEASQTPQRGSVKTISREVTNG